MAYAATNGGCDVSPKYGGISLDKAATFLADMDDIKSAYYDPVTDRIVFIGTATTSLPQFDKDDLAVAIRAVIFNSTNPAVDMNFKDSSTMNVVLYGGVDDTQFGQKLVDADYWLKKYIHGYDENDNSISSSVPGYQSMLSRFLAKGNHPIDGADVSRWWISPQTITLKEATSTDAFVFDQVKMQVETEAVNQGNSQEWNDAAAEFAAHMTQYYDSYAQERTEFQKVKQLAEIVGVIKWIKDNNIGTDFEWAKNYTPVFVDTPTELPRLTTPFVDGGDGHSHALSGGVDYNTPNSYGTDTQGTSTVLRSASETAATSSTDGIHWNFNSNGQAYESVAVSAEVFRTVGAYGYTAADATAPTPSTVPLEIKRSYSSLSAKEMGFGPGWSFLPASLSNLKPGSTAFCSFGGYTGFFPTKLAITTPFGRETFTFSCASGYTADDSRYHSTLTRDANGTYRVTTKDRTTYLFYADIATASEYKLIQSYDIHSGDPNNFVRKYYWGPATSTLLTIQDTHPSSTPPTMFDGHNIALGWNASSTKIATVIAPTGTTTYAYNGNGDLITVTDPRGNSTTYTYNPVHTLQKITNRVGTQIINNTYDAKGRVLTQVDVNNITRTFTYDDTNRILSWIDTNGRKGKETYDDLARVLQSVNALGATTTFAYGTTTDAATSIVDAKNATSTFIYDTKGNVTSFTAPNGGQLNFVWNGTNDLTQITDNHYTSILGSPRLTKYTYDSKSNVNQSTIAGQATTTYTYTPRGQIATSTDSSSNSTQFFYNAYGLPTLVKDKLGQNTAFTYDNAGRVTQTVDPIGMTTTFTYDASGNKLTATTPAAVARYTYDANDRLTSIIDPVNATTSFVYTKADKIATTTDALGASTHYFYDAYGNLVKARNALSRDTSFSYDIANLQTSSLLPSGKTRTTSYDFLNNPLVVTQPNGLISTSTYDSLNRVTSKKIGSQTLLYTYDTAGRLSTVGSSVGTTTYGYDARDRVTQVTNPYSAAVGYQYDDRDNLTKIMYSDNKTVQNTFNAAGQLTQQTDWTGGATTYTYTSFGALDLTTLPNSITVKREYDSANRLATTTYKNAAQTILFREVYKRDARGFITKITQDGSAQSANTTNYQYDLGGRLKSGVSNATNESYIYDAVGNMTTRGEGAATTTFEHNVDNELATSTRTGPVSFGGGGGSFAMSAPVYSLSNSSPQRSAVATFGAQLLLAPPENQYTETADSYEVALGKKNSDSGESSVKLLKDRPEVRLKKWNGEVDLGVSYGKVQATGSRAPSTDRVEWKGTKEEVHAYPLNAAAGMEDGGFEIEIVLKDKPTTNVFTFALDGVMDLDFFYQAPLTQEEINQGATRPENVIGSYAVYHKAKKDHEIKGINYASGKVFHIYRPKAIDANGNEAWGVLSYTGGKLSVEIPQDFLEKAAYPVRVDPTFGYTSAGASTAAITNSLRGSLFTSPSDYGSFTSGSIYISHSLSGGNVKVVIAKHSDLNIVTNGISNGISAPSTGWYTPTFASNPSLVASTDYVLTGITDSVVNKITYDSGTTNQGHVDSSNTYSSPSNPTDATHDNNKYAVYITYTASGGGNNAPTAPTSLLTEGSTNPTDISDSTPEFSAIYNDPDASDSAKFYNIQVATSSGFASTYWDSGKTAMATTSQGARSPEISYGGSALASSTTYYWRIKFWDVADAAGVWSTATSTFSLAASGGGGG